MINISVSIPLPHDNYLTLTFKDDYCLIDTDQLWHSYELTRQNVIELWTVLNRTTNAKCREILYLENVNRYIIIDSTNKLQLWFIEPGDNPVIVDMYNTTLATIRKHIMHYIAYTK